MLIIVLGAGCAVLTMTRSLLSWGVWPGLPSIFPFANMVTIAFCDVMRVL